VTQVAHCPSIRALAVRGLSCQSPVMLRRNPTAKRQPPGYIEPCIPTLLGAGGISYLRDRGPPVRSVRKVLIPDASLCT
jgi:hypothetical protein